VITPATGCDALIHEVYAGRGVNPAKVPCQLEQWMEYESEFHTSAPELEKLPKAKAGCSFDALDSIGNAKERIWCANPAKTYSGRSLWARLGCDCRKRGEEAVRAYDAAVGLMKCFSAAQPCFIPNEVRNLRCL